MGRKSKNHAAKIVLVGILVIFCATVPSSIFYVKNYSHAEQSALDVLANPPSGVAISYGPDGELVFRPAAGSHFEGGLVFYPGGKVEYSAYAPLLAKLAERGIFSVLVKMPCNLAILDADAAGNILKRYPEVLDWYIGGHSLGGVAAAMYAAKHSADFRGLLLLAAYSSSDLSKTDLSVLSLFGERDGVLNQKVYEKAKSNLPADFTEFIIPGGCHSYFGNYGSQKGDGVPTCSREEQQTFSADKISDWMKVD